MGISSFDALALLPLVVGAPARERAAHRKKLQAASAGQVPAFEMIFNQRADALHANFALIQSMPSDTAAQVHDKEVTFARFEADVDPAIAAPLVKRGE